VTQIHLLQLDEVRTTKNNSRIRLLRIGIGYDCESVVLETDASITVICKAAGCCAPSSSVAVTMK
jgi:hypothetical protein